MDYTDHGKIGTTGELAAIGDIHGMHELLDALLMKLPASATLVFLGDYIDRGPGSREVLERLLALADTRPCVFLRGNHEEMLFAALADEPQARLHWLRNGGMQTLESYGGKFPPEEHIAFLDDTLPYLETEDYIFVHAGLAPGRPAAASTPMEWFWIREPFLSSPYNWGKTVVHGHTPSRTRTPEIRLNRINIDTGAVYGGALTAVLLPECRFIRQPAP